MANKDRPAVEVLPPEDTPSHPPVQDQSPQLIAEINRLQSLVRVFETRYNKAHNEVFSLEIDKANLEARVAELEGKE